MAPRDLFGLIVRVAGLACVVFALFDAYYVFAKIAGFDAASRQTLTQAIAGFLLYGALGWIGFRGADRVVALTYGRAKNE